MSADSDLRDQAVSHLKASTVSYPQWSSLLQQGRYNPPDGSSTEWGKALALLDQIGSGDTPVPPEPPVAGGVWNWDARTAKVDPNSAAIVADFIAKAGFPSYLNAGNAVVFAKDSDPSYTVSAPQGKFDNPVKIPANTKAGCDDDGHLAIVGPAGRSTDMYQGKFANGKWSCAGGGSFDTGAYTEGQVNNSNAASFPLEPSMLTPDDVKNGTVRPLSLSVAPAALGAATRYPGVGDTYPGSGLTGMGMWFRFPPSLAMPSGLSVDEQAMFHCGQERGFFVRDGGNPVNVTAVDCVNSGGNAKAWGDVGVTLPSTVNGYPYARQMSSKFPWAKLECLAPPAK